MLSKGISEETLKLITMALLTWLKCLLLYVNPYSILKKKTATIKAPVMSVGFHSLGYFLLASVASLASFGLCAIIVRAHKRVSGVMYLVTSNRKKCNRNESRLHCLPHCLFLLFCLPTWVAGEGPPWQFLKLIELTEGSVMFSGRHLDRDRHRRGSQTGFTPEPAQRPALVWPDFVTWDRRLQQSHQNKESTVPTVHTCCCL